MRCKACGAEMELVHTDWEVDFSSPTLGKRCWDDFYSCPVCGQKCLSLVNYWSDLFPFDAAVYWLD